MTLDNIQPMKHFGERLKELRVSFGYTQERLTDEIDYNRNNYVRVEGGHRPASDLLLEKLASIYKMGFDQLKSERDAKLIQSQFSAEAIKEAFRELVSPETFDVIMNGIAEQGIETIIEISKKEKRRRKEAENKS